MTELTELTELVFPDHQELADLGRYAVRAMSVDDSGAIRLQATGTTLAAYVGVLPGSGLMGEGTVLGLRVVALAEAAAVDATVPLGAITDRVARDTAGRVLPVPPTRVRAPWAALSPPRSGWQRVGAVSSEDVAAAAREGIAAVAKGAPQGSGGHAVTALRARTWRSPTTTAPAFASGGAFAAYALGFLVPGGEVTVFEHGRWTRLTTSAGHVLIR
jgi:hypothetical protein